MKLLPEGYCIDTTEVTREQYQTWIGTNPVASAVTQIAECAWNTSFVPGTDASYDWPPTQHLKAPVMYVDWCDAYAYCFGVGKRLCGKIGGGVISDAESTADPTSSEWINACSSHGAYDYVYGDTYVQGVCNVNAPSLMSVGSLSGCQSPLSDYAGVFDLSGNMDEWEDNCTPGEGMTAGCILRGGNYSIWDTGSMCVTHYGVYRSALGYGIRCCSS